MKTKVPKNKHKHQSNVPPGFFVYKGMVARYSDINPEIQNDFIDEDFKERMRQILADNKSFCEQYCTEEFWHHALGEGHCYLYLIKKKLNELHISKSSKGKYKCNLKKIIC